MKPTVFEFSSYKTDLKKRTISFTYRIRFADAKPLTFTERLVLPQPISAKVSPQLLKNILEGLHLMLGISYYKLYVPQKAKVPYQLTGEQATFWNTVYRKGLGEFAYRNKLDPKRFAIFFASKKQKGSSAFSYPRADRVLSMIGGGKDSIVSTELLKEGRRPITALHIQTQRENVVTNELLKALHLPQLTIKRYLDEQIFKPHPGSYNGHIPISAVLAFTSVLAAILYDYRCCVVANEYSSNFGNVKYKGEVINHQWSKSAEFEQLFSAYVRNYITPDVTYFSLLRHSHELRIVKLFTQYPKYFKLFSSCNRVARIIPPFLKEVPGSGGGFKSLTVNGPLPLLRERRVNLWCGECPKCAFAFTILAAFLPKEKVLAIFRKNLFADEGLIPLFEDLLGFGTMKPFDCVGTFEEMQSAFYLASKKFSQDAVIKKFVSRVQKAGKLLPAILQTYPAPLIPAQFAFIGVRRLLILGYGREGKITEQYLKKYHPKISVGIADKIADSHYLQKQGSYDIAIKTPGIPKELVSIFYTTATNIFFSAIAIKNQSAQQQKYHILNDRSKCDIQIIGVTGSKGKSTTASLIYAILKQAKRKVFLLGNIGGPMLSALLKPIPKDAIFVLELSSYQLDDIQMSPQISVVTNLFPEHMNYHGGIAQYYDAKKNIIAYQQAKDHFVYNPKVALLRQWVRTSTSHAVPYHAKLPLKAGDIPLLGEHNRDNARAAVTTTRLLGIADAISAKAIRSFKALPHRLEPVGVYRGIRFYDDAISTTPESTIEALKSLPSVVTIFLGGEDRGYDFRDLEAAIKRSRIKNVVLFPDSGNKMFKNPGKLRILRTRSMKHGVAFAYQHTPAGSVCLLSMASPSYSLWRDFIEKGNEFQKWVKRYGK